MIALLLIALLLIVLFAGLGVALSPLFFLLILLVVLVAAFGGMRGRGRGGL